MKNELNRKLTTQPENCKEYKNIRYQYTKTHKSKYKLEVVTLLMILYEAKNEIKNNAIPQIAIFTCKPSVNLKISTTVYHKYPKKDSQLTLILS